MRLLAAALLLSSTVAVAEDAPQTEPWVSPTAVEANWIAGENAITPSDATKAELKRAGKDRVAGSFKLCLDSAGVPTMVATLTSTAFRAYDQELHDKIQGRRYKPFQIGGKPTAVCTEVTVVYVRKQPGPEPRKRISSADLEKLRPSGLTKTAVNQTRAWVEEALPDPRKITPAPWTLADMDKKRQTKATGEFLVCLDTAGTVTHVRALSGTGFADYDDKIELAMHTWTFRPWTHNGTPVAVCAPVTITFAK
jgi:hypothetical protein